jgi:putative oxidoreductase
MTRFLEPHTERIYASLRIVTGLLFLCHGAQKIFGLFGGPPAALSPALMWSAGAIELVGGAMILAGFMTGWAAFVCSGQMAVAYFMAHQAQGLLPIQNRGELAALYSFVFLFIAARGAGKWSVDAARGRG